MLPSSSAQLYVWSWIVSSIADVLSLTACVWLLCRFYQNRNDLKQRLFPKLITSLALADVFFHFIDLWYGIFWAFMWYDVFPTSLGPWYCKALNGIWYAAEFVSLLQEALISLYCLSVAFRCPSMWPALTWLVPATWFVGIALGIMNDFLAQWHYDDGVCVYNNENYIEVATMVFSVSVSFLAYVSMVIRSWCCKSPNSIHRRYVRRLVLYPLTVVFSFFPGVLSDSSLALYNIAAFDIVQGTTASLNGLLNVAAYAWQSQYHTLLFSGLRPYRRSYARSWNVDFAEDEVVSVSYTQAEAKEYAAQQIASLHRSQESIEAGRSQGAEGHATSSQR